MKIYFKLKIRNSAFRVRTSFVVENLESQNKESSNNISQSSFIKTEDFSNSKIISYCEDEREMSLSLNAYIYREKPSSKMNSNKNTPNFQKDNKDIYLGYLGEGKLLENENKKKVNFFTLKKNLYHLDFQDNKVSDLNEKLKQSYFIYQINSISNLQNDFNKNKSKNKVSEIKKTIQDLERKNLEFTNIERMLNNKKVELKEISDDRNQLIANKINLENNFDSLAIKFNKLQDKNREYFTSKDKISKNLKLDNTSFNSNNSPVKPCFGIVITEKNLDELIYELENKFAFIKIENGILSEKIDNVDEAIEVNEIKKKVTLFLYLFPKNFI